MSAQGVADRVLIDPPYAATAEAYLAAGWAPLPLPAGRKKSPPKGYTGEAGAWPTSGRVQKWVRDRGAGNVGLRLPANVVGIDVDDHSGKGGGATLRDLEQKLGPLPPTWIGTSRNDGVSGIRFFRAPEGVKWPDFGAGIEALRHGYRYAVAWPSDHPDTGQTYKWFDPDGNEVEAIPRVDDLPELPAAWVAHFTALAEQSSADSGTVAATATGPATPAHVEKARSVLAKAVREVKVSAGGRNNTVSRCLLMPYNFVKADALDREEVESALWDAVPQRAEPYTRDEFRASCASAWGEARPELPRLDDPSEDFGSELGAVKVVDKTHRGQVRMAYRLAERYAGRLMHVHEVGWFVWGGKRWVEDQRGKAKRAVVAVLRSALSDSLHDRDLQQDVRKCESAAGIAGVLSIAAALEEFAMTADDLDADPYLLNTANGTLDLRTMELRDADPQDHITRITNASYDPEAPGGAAWQEFLSRVLPDAEVRLYLRRYVGLALLGRVREHTLVILTGEGRNGKGVFYGSVNFALGDYAAVAEPDLFMHREGAHPTGQMDLRGRRWVIVSESDSGRRLAEATVKRLTGGDAIKARRMHKNFVEFEPSHTAALVTNYLPQVSGNDPAMWARLRVAPFDVVIPEGERDPKLGEKLQLSADAILSWAVAGWQDYEARGGLADPTAVLRATERYHTDSDALTRFVQDACVVDQSAHVTVGDLFARWERWRYDEGSVPEMGKRAFGTELQSRGFPAATTGANKTRIRQGLRLRDEESDD